MNTDERLNRLEMTIAHQEKQIDELSEMTAKQWDIIERLKRQLDMTQKQLADMESHTKDAKSEVGLSSIEVAALNKPPHY